MIRDLLDCPECWTEIDCEGIPEYSDVTCPECGVVSRLRSEWSQEEADLILKLVSTALT